jgi:cell wall-associated NlpC family hydrolase
MGVFLYQPGIKVYIETASNGTLDVSGDLVSGNLVRRSNGVSSFTFTLQNVRRKYDGIFTPNDRIIVMMKRLTWVRALTGYLNAVPLVTAWPQDIQFTASCSLKRLQYYYWDPALMASQSLVASAMASVKNPDDGGVANAVLTILDNVVGWPPDKVHIAGIPQSWMKFAYKIAKAVAAEAAEADQLSQQFYSVLGGNGAVGGNIGGNAVGSGALKAGTYGGYAITEDQAKVAVIIYNTCVQMGGSSRDAAVGIMVSMTESSLGADPSTNLGVGGSYGIFQQRPQDGWGTVAQVEDDAYAARAFFGVLFKISGRNGMTLWAEGQAVQRSAYADGSNYQVFASLGTQIASVLSNSSGASSLGNTTPLQQLAKQNTGGVSSGPSLLATAMNLVTDHPTIPYQEGGDSPPNTPAAEITFLDCSSFVQWCVFNTLGNLGPSGGCPRTSQDQSAWCQSAGKIISAAQGMNIPGALMYIGQPGQATHTEMSVGDGKHTVGSHHSGTYAGEITSDGYWTIAGLPPGFDFSGVTGISPSAGAGSSTSVGFQLTPANTQPWYNPNDQFDKLFGTTPWVPTFDSDAAVVAEAFTGVRALLPDTPLLPYVGNLVTSTLRSYSSAPNGDFIAWFPDYYGLWGTAAIMQIEPVELQDFTVFWDDTYLVTHQYTAAPPAIGVDLATATMENVGPVIAVTTTGIATIDIPGIMYALFGLEPTQAAAQKFINFVYTRFGARPDYQQLPGVVGPQGEFFSALYLFMQNWAYQYNADISLTFMPELWPGMLIQVPTFGFQAYVTTVTHSFQFGPGGYFNTTVNIAAPARLPGNGGNSSGNLIGLPLAGGLTGQPSLPGTGGG